jgi:hypothetical protein
LENADDDLTDYKIWCFDGKVYAIAIVSGRSRHNLNITYFLPQWESIALRDEYPQHDQPIEKPEKLPEMIALAEQIAKEVAHVRVDLYLLNDGQIKLGECTFTPTSGACHWRSQEVDRMLGDLFALPESSPMPRP